MEFKMLLVNFGVLLLVCFMKPVQLTKSKDSMELSAYTFLWEDAQARCERQGQILAPGRRFRAKLIKRLMIKDKIDAVWLNGWRAVSDIKPDKDGKLSTLKVDFSRPQSKQLKMICQYNTQYYDPTYRAESTEVARKMCWKDKATLAEVTTEDDVLQITKDMIVDSPHWINSISSQGSKIKQCLVAKLVGDELKYSYEDCAQEYNFFCVKGDDVISSFSPLISLKMARFEEFEEEIEKHTQSMATSTEIFEFFSSIPLPSESSSIDISSAIASTPPEPPMTPSEVATTPSVQPEMTSADFTSSVQPLVTAADFTSSVQPDATSDTTTTSVTIETTSSVVVYDADTSIMDSIQPSPTYTEMTPTIDDISPTKAVTPSPPISRSSNPSPVSSSTEYMHSKLPTLGSDIIIIRPTSIVKDTKVTKMMVPSSSQITDSSSIDKYYRESVFVEPESSTVSEKYITDEVSASIADEISSMSTTEVLSPSIFINSTGYQSVIDIPMNTATGTIVLQTTQIITPALPSSSYTDMQDIDDSEETMSIESVDMGEVLTVQATSASVLQTPVIIEPSSTQTIMSNESKTSSHMFSDSIALSTFTSSSKDFMAIESASSYGSRAHAPSSLFVQTSSQTSLSSDECTVVDSTTLCGDIIIPDNSITLDDLESTSAVSNYITPSITYTMTDTPSSTSSSSSSSSSLSTPSLTSYSSKSSSSSPSSLSSSSTTSSSSFSTLSLTPYPSKSSYPEFEEDFTNIIRPTSSLVSEISTTPYYYDYYSKEPDTVDSEEDQTLPPFFEATPEYTTSTTDEYDIENVDEDIPGDLDEGDTNEENEVGNASAGEIVEKKEDDEDEGTEVGLWVAFAILITLVLIALILAAYLYRKRKQEKSKDINEAAPPAAAGETVELRDSRSPSRENGKPRESTTFKDPAYDI